MQLLGFILFMKKQYVKYCISLRLACKRRRDTRKVNQNTS